MTNTSRAARWIEEFCVVPGGAQKGQRVPITDNSAKPRAGFTTSRRAAKPCRSAARWPRISRCCISADLKHCSASLCRRSRPIFSRRGARSAPLCGKCSSLSAVKLPAPNLAHATRRQHDLVIRPATRRDHAGSLTAAGREALAVSRTCRGDVEDARSGCRRRCETGCGVGAVRADPAASGVKREAARKMCARMCAQALCQLRPDRP